MNLPYPIILLIYDYLQSLFNQKKFVSALNIPILNNIYSQDNYKFMEQHIHYFISPDLFTIIKQKNLIIQHFLDYLYIYQNLYNIQKTITTSSTIPTWNYTSNISFLNIITLSDGYYFHIEEMPAHVEYPADIALTIMDIHKDDCFLNSMPYGLSDFQISLFHPDKQIAYKMLHEFPQQCKPSNVDYFENTALIIAMYECDEKFIIDLIDTFGKSLLPFHKNRQSENAFHIAIFDCMSIDLIKYMIDRLLDKNYNKYIPVIEKYQSSKDMTKKEINELIKVFNKP